MEKIGIAELRADLSKHINDVISSQKTIKITKNNVTIAEIRPIKKTVRKKAKKCNPFFGFVN